MSVFGDRECQVPVISHRPCQTALSAVEQGIVLDAANRLATTAATNGTPSRTLRISFAQARAELDRLKPEIA